MPAMKVLVCTSPIRVVFWSPLIGSPGLLRLPRHSERCIVPVVFFEKLI